MQARRPTTPPPRPHLRTPPARPPRPPPPGAAPRRRRRRAARRAALQRVLCVLPPAALAVAFSGCSDDRRGADALTGPGRPALARSADGAAALGAPVASFSGAVDPAAPLANVRCTVIVGPTPGLSCASSTTGGYRVEGSRLVVGGHGSFVAVSGGGGSYKDGTLLVDAAVRNLIYQALGTVDGTSPHADGVRLVLVGTPAVTGGTGSVAAVGDGVAAVTAPDQPYWQYGTVLDELELSAPKALKFQITGAVTAYTVDLVAAAAVQHPGGRMTLTPGSATLASGQQQQLVATARDAVGSPVAAEQTTWTSADPMLATVGADGVVSALRAGTVAITAARSFGAASRRLREGAFGITSTCPSARGMMSMKASARSVSRILCAGSSPRRILAKMLLSS